MWSWYSPSNRLNGLLGQRLGLQPLPWIDEQDPQHPFCLWRVERAKLLPHHEGIWVTLLSDEYPPKAQLSVPGEVRVPESILQADACGFGRDVGGNENVVGVWDRLGILEKLVGRLPSQPRLPRVVSFTYDDPLAFRQIYLYDEIGFCTRRMGFSLYLYLTDERDFGQAVLKGASRSLLDLTFRFHCSTSFHQLVKDLVAAKLGPVKSRFPI